MPTTGTADSGTNPAPMPLETAEQFASALQRLIADARRHIVIYSQHLARPLYHEPHTVQALSDFARSSRYARVQILICDSEPLLRSPHRMLPLIQRLESRIELRKTQPGSEPDNYEFALADDRQLLLRTDGEKWLGQYQDENAVRTRQLREIFERAWLHAQPDPNLKQFFL
ncbi:DUF7931 domain-containing protein [Microbulbifer pacificus]|uniref:DUF7931 domain-containing protein n=1 Tax=Microbulbifer pacificus TaxID=407164 RepID=A0AAU0MZN5_9GAMM|nr:hypothetical protein [Microbulbifer pacificus]WOX05671.1 hypothetical protein R5R33_00570 [Microbulbifer pacificus]